MCLMRWSASGRPLCPWSASAGVAHSESRATQRTEACRNGRFTKLLPKFDVPRIRGTPVARSMSREVGARVHAPFAVGQTDERRARRAGLDRGDDPDASVGELHLGPRRVGQDYAPEALHDLAIEDAAGAIGDDPPPVGRGAR